MLLYLGQVLPGVCASMGQQHSMNKWGVLTQYQVLFLRYQGLAGKLGQMPCPNLLLPDALLNLPKLLGTHGHFHLTFSTFSFHDYILIAVHCLPAFARSLLYYLCIFILIL